MENKLSLFLIDDGEILMKHLSKLVVILASILLLCSGSYATTIEFEDPIANQTGGVSVYNFQEGGFSVTGPVVVFADGWQDGRGPSNGTTTMGPYSSDGRAIINDLFSTSGNPFSIQSIDFAETFQVGDYLGDFVLGFRAERVDIFGYKSDGTTLTNTFVFDMINDGQGPGKDFQTFSFDQSWTNLRDVRFVGTRDVISYGVYYQMDNIVLNEPFSTPSPVIPEPSTFILFGSGIIFGFCRTRKNSRVF